MPQQNRKYSAGPFLLFVCAAGRLPINQLTSFLHQPRNGASHPEDHNRFYSNPSVKFNALFCPYFSAAAAADIVPADRAWNSIPDRLPLLNCLTFPNMPRRIFLHIPCKVNADT